jgi:hypothetical protein
MSYRQLQAEAHSLRSIAATMDYAPLAFREELRGIANRIELLVQFLRDAEANRVIDLVIGQSANIGDAAAMVATIRRCSWSEARDTVRARVAAGVVAGWSQMRFDGETLRFPTWQGDVA